MGFVIGRLGQTLIVLLVAALVSFMLFRYVGDPVNNMVGQAASLADREAMRTQLGLNDPVAVQFARFVGDVLRGDLGMSYRFGQPISDLLLQRLPATLELSLVSILLAAGLGVPLGVWSAVRNSTWPPTDWRDCTSCTATSSGAVPVPLPRRRSWPPSKPWPTANRSAPRWPPPPTRSRHWKKPPTSLCCCAAPRPGF